MPIFYACIRIDPRTTVEHSTRAGTYGAEAHRVMQKIDVNMDKRASYSADSVVFHVQVSGKVLFLAVCDAEFKQLQAFNFLKKLKELYSTNRGPNAIQGLYGHLKREMELFNSGKGDKIQTLQSEIDAVKCVMMENVDQLLDRGEKINILVSNTEQLNDASQNFFESSRSLKNKMWWKNVKIMILIAVVIVIVIFVIVLIACGGFTFEKCKSKKDNGK